MQYCCDVQQPQEVIVAKQIPENVSGSPKKVPTALGEAVAFDGVDDALFFGINQLYGIEDELTLECTFYVDKDGEFEQRFLHIGDVNKERIMMELRLKPDGTWYLDAHTATYNNATSLTLIDPELVHPSECWVNAVLVVDNGHLTSYVNGVKQCEGDLDYVPISTGITSVGARQNKISWFKGMIYEIKVTPKALKPEEFSQDYIKLNGR